MVPSLKGFCQLALTLLLASTAVRGETAKKRRTPANDGAAAQVVGVTGQPRAGNRILVPGDKLAVGEQVTTDDESEAKLLLADDSIIDVTPSSRFKIEKMNGAKSGERDVALAVDDGRVRAFIKKKLQGPGKMIIRTRASVLAVRGTELLVETRRSGDRADESVTVREGNVAATFPGRPEVAIRPGQRLAAVADSSGAGWSLRQGGFNLRAVSPKDLTAAFDRGTVRDRTFVQGIVVGPRGGGPLGGRETLRTVVSQFKPMGAPTPGWRPAPERVLRQYTPDRGDTSPGHRRPGADRWIDVGGTNVSEVDITVIFKP